MLLLSTSQKIAIPISLEWHRKLNLIKIVLLPLQKIQSITLDVFVFVSFLSPHTFSLIIAFLLLKLNIDQLLII